MERARQQPDFSQVAHNFRDAAEHFERCENLPAVDGGARLLERMELMMERFTALEQTMNRRFDQVDRRMDGLDRKVIVSNRNAVVRARNGTVVRGDMDLVPLHSVLTGEVIDGFPRNVNQMERLHARDVDQLLLHVGESVVGSAAEKKKNLKFATGLVTREL
ncbi:hypothetical protein HRG_002112 [Hirsutella rhossiliensis]|uniref:Uncharacterized protein n=1 Tax=Hirsutella rhossiliensis TaxID=111463 RepID=A0A9P8N2Y7_9HYPO|nr:uncharacterized protein HRG_02112 [Hirsutella rhossiliensis]KAH0966703.1 hypothetical protein HRG_02112 [Hirsutella rhossiliensis]